MGAVNAAARDEINRRPSTKDLVEVLAVVEESMIINVLWVLLSVPSFVVL